jgi:hypothetical protein
LPWRRLLRGALGLAVLGAGAYAYLRFFGETPLERQVREAATADASYADESLGVRLELPRGWRILQKGSSLVAAPPDARVTLAQGRTATFAFLTVETSPPKVTSLDDYLDRVLSQRKPAEGSPFEESGRTDVSVGGLPGRRAAGAWGKGDDRHQEHTVVWKDGWVYFALTAWAPEASTAAPRALDALVAGFRTNGALDDRVRSAVQMVTREVPILSASGAETLMSRSAARVLEPDQAFRRSIEALCRALVRWKAAEVRELGRLTTAAYAQLPGKDRSRLARYFEKVRANESTSSQEDREASLIMKKAVLHLSAAQQQRFREVCERAIRDSAGTY